MRLSSGCCAAQTAAARLPAIAPPKLRWSFITAQRNGPRRAGYLSTADVLHQRPAVRAVGPSRARAQARRQPDRLLDRARDPGAGDAGLLPPLADRPRARAEPGAGDPRGQPP